MSVLNGTRNDKQCLLDMVKLRYANRLTAGEMQEVQKAVNGILDAADALRSVKLENSDEPFTLLVPYRKER